MTTLANDLTLGSPQLAGPLTVFPVFGPEPQFVYRSFAQAIALGALVKELDGRASVNDLTLVNPTDLPLLVYEGEEVLSAQQNRTFDVSVLLDARATVRVPVSCVEAGRWDGSRHGEAFAPSPQTADPSLRARKREVANLHAQAGMEARPDQREVWAEVSDKLIAHGVHSESAAMSDLYDERREELDEMVDRVSHEAGQVGAVALVGGRPVALDVVSRADAFASLLPRLAQGYALDALRMEDAEADPFEAERFLDSALHATRAELPTPGMGRGIRLADPALTGSGIAHDGELVQLSAFPAEASEDAGEAEGGAPIARPSRRRRADGAPVRLLHMAEPNQDTLYATTLQTIGAVAQLPIVRVGREAFLRKHFAASPHLNLIL